MSHARKARSLVQVQHVAMQSQTQMSVRSQPALCCCQVVRKKRDRALAQQEAAVKAKKERTSKREEAGAG